MPDGQQERCPRCGGPIKPLSEKHHIICRDPFHSPPRHTDEEIEDAAEQFERWADELDPERAEVEKRLPTADEVRGILKPDTEAEEEGERFTQDKIQDAIHGVGAGQIDPAGVTSWLLELLALYEKAVEERDELRGWLAERIEVQRGAEDAELEARSERDRLASQLREAREALREAREALERIEAKGDRVITAPDGLPMIVLVDDRGQADCAEIARQALARIREESGACLASQLREAREALERIANFGPSWAESIPRRAVEHLRIIARHALTRIKEE